MSSMLEQAIIDAEALKGAALKNAEQLVIEKYANEIKEAVDTLLEQPEEEAGLEDLGLEAGEEELAELPAAAEGLPSVHVDGERFCPCPDEEEEVELELDIQALGEKLEQEMEGLSDSEIEDIKQPHETLVQELAEDIKISLEELEIIDEEEEEDILEDLEIDLEVVPRGSTSIGPATPRQQEEAEDIALAKEKLEEKEEENENLRESVKQMKNERKEILELVEKYKTTFDKLKNKLEETNISNAKLLYTNRVLSGTSLNGRQKAKIVEALSKAKTVEETKVIYETLQSAVGEHLRKKPKSLNEAVERRSSILLPRTQNRAKEADPVTSRWKQLAGINN